MDRLIAFAALAVANGSLINMYKARKLYRMAAFRCTAARW